MFDLASEIIQTMRHNKLRTALTGLSVAWGIFMLITLLSVAGAITRDFEDNMQSSSTQKMSIWGGITTKPYHGFREGRSVDLKHSDMAALESEHSGVVESVTSEIDGSSENISTNTTYIKAGYTGVYPSAKELNNIQMTHGRFINDEDIRTRAKVMVMAPEYAEQLFPPDGSDAVGKMVSYKGLSFLIVGVFQTRWGRNIYIPYTTAQALTEHKDDVGQVTVQMKNVQSAEEASDIEKDMRSTLGARHNFDPEDESAVWIWNAVQQAMTARTGIGILNIGVWVLGLLTLLSGIIGISNIMFVSVRERTHEIGIRRAIGAKPHKILTQILAESVAITTLFGYIGIVMGVLLTEVLSKLFGSMLEDAHVDLSIAAQVTVVLIVAGALAGLFPALKALKVKPVEALRDE